MISKRKLIKKHHKKNNNVNKIIQQQISSQTPTTILQRLNDIDKNNQQQAITIISNLYQIPPSILNHEILQALINKLYNADNSIIYGTLFALENIAALNLQIIPKLFDMGLDKALIQLKSTNNQLFKPILILMTTISAHVPKKYNYLILGIQNTLATVQNLKKEQNIKQLVLQFFIQSNLKLKQLNNEFISQLWNIFKTDKSFKCRGNALRLILNSRKDFINSNNEQSIKQLSTLNNILMQYLEQTIIDIDLQHEYQFNIQKKLSKGLQHEKMNDKQDVMDQQGLLNNPTTKQDQMIQVINEKHIQNKNKNESQLQQAFGMFLNSVQSVQITLEIMIQLQEQWQQDQEQQQQDFQQQDEEIINQQNNQKQKQNSQSNIIDLTTCINHFITQNIKKMYQNVTLPFQQSLIIAQYTLRLINNLTKLPNFNQIFNEATIIAQDSIQNLIKFNPSSIISQQNISLALQILQKTKILKKRQTIIGLVQYMSISLFWKNCWINLLEIISLHFNPQKNKVNFEQNLKIGQILKKLMIEIPYKELQQWRCQTIDTIFDVYSNEDHDKIFVQLGFIVILQQVQSMGNQILNKKGKGKKSKFLRDTIVDVGRFLDYKKKMIKY